MLKSGFKFRSKELIKSWFDHDISPNLAQDRLMHSPFLTLYEIPLTTSSVFAANGGDACVAVEPGKKQDLFNIDFKTQANK